MVRGRSRVGGRRRVGTVVARRATRGVLGTDCTRKVLAKVTERRSRRSMSTMKVTVPVHSGESRMWRETVATVNAAPQLVEKDLVVLGDGRPHLQLGDGRTSAPPQRELRSGRVRKSQRRRAVGVIPVNHGQLVGLAFASQLPLQALRYQVSRMHKIQCWRCLVVSIPRSAPAAR